MPAPLLGTSSTGPQLSLPVRPRYSNLVSKSDPTSPTLHKSNIPGEDHGVKERSSSEDLLTVVSHSTNLPRISDLLLSSVPYSLKMQTYPEPGDPYVASLVPTLRYLDIGEGAHAEKEATDFVRTLLHEWTDTPTPSISALLEANVAPSRSPRIEGISRQTEDDKLPEAGPILPGSTPIPVFELPGHYGHPNSLPSQPVEMSADPVVSKESQRVSEEEKEVVKESQEQEQVAVRKAWESTSLGEPPLNTVLANAGGKFVWMHHDDFETTFFVQDQECLRYRILPAEEKRADEETEVRTLVSKQWVLKEVIDAFNKPFDEHDAALYSIKGKLSFVSHSKGQSFPLCAFEN
jgi:hypothetical protein